MLTTLILALMGPLAVFVGLVVFKNAFVTFLLFHGFVCIGIPAIDYYGVRKWDHRDVAATLGLTGNRDAIRVGVWTGIVFLVVILGFFYLLRDSIINPDEIQLLLTSWNIQKRHVLVLLFVMILANSVLEEIYWRGFIFERLWAHAGATKAVAISSLFYGSYHFITTANLFSIQIGVLFTTVILMAGVFWGIVRERFGSLYASLIGHFLADLAIMIIYLVHIQQHLTG